MESNPNRLPSHVVLFPSPGMGHLIPFAELAKQLVVRHQLTATIVTFADFQASTLLSSLPSSISNATLPPPPLDDLPPKAHVITRISYTMARAASPLRELLASLSRSTRVCAVFVDLLGGDTLSAARELGIPTYIFFTSNFFCLSFFLHLPALDEATTGEYRDLPEPLRLPGCVDLWGEDFLEPIQDRSNDACSWVVHHAGNHRLVDGIIVNSFEAPEIDAAQFFKQNELGVPPIWGIGPLTWASSKPNSDPHNCLGWLDEQPDGSVLLLCFGSGGTLSWQQTQELALGLEMSGQRFCGQPVRRPRKIQARASSRTGGRQRRPARFLARWVLAENQREGDGGAVVGPAVGGAGPRGDRRVLVALRVELDAGVPGARRADDRLASVLGAEDERRAGPRGDRRVLVALRVELDAGVPGARRADDRLASVLGAEDERRAAGGGDEGGAEAGAGRGRGGGERAGGYGCEGADGG
ncbi:hypothetical protein HPP92_008955 [Vanilla planifolia]|uniref:Uncharacterized protein n=1 Tax=Vanilla planifolia TaxID=51239 RepID=A0A835R7B2_VANPL|nr:hypothetical protein HPP92_008955 [Vanilla planifolia]